MITSDVAINGIITILMGFGVIWVQYRLNKRTLENQVRLKKSETANTVTIKEIQELNNKMHTALNDFIDSIKENKLPGKRTTTRINNCASRFSKFLNEENSELVQRVTAMLNTWEIILDLHSQNQVDDGVLSATRADCIQIAEEIRGMIDTVWKKYVN